MNEYQRFEKLIAYLIETKRVRNQQQFVEEINSDRSTVSEVKNGKLKIPNNMFGKIENAYPDISIDWLKSGEGEMLKNTQQIENVSNSTVVGNNVSGTGISISHNDFSEMIELQKGYQELLKKKDEHISELLSTVKTLAGYGK